MKSKLMKCLALMLVVGLMAVTGAIAEDGSVTGKVEQTDSGIVISADDGTTYSVMGADLTEMIGQTVKATGTLAESESGKVLTVVSVEPVQE
jgi:hypothetical protein